MVRFVELTVTPTLVPVPLSATVCGDPAPLSVTVIAPLRTPESVGVNVTAILQLAAAARDVPHVFVCAKSPKAAIDIIVSAACPLLVSVTVCAALVDPT